MSKKAARIEIVYDDGSASFAEGESAETIWRWLMAGETMNIIHGAQYSGVVLQECTGSPLEQRIRAEEREACAKIADKEWMSIDDRDSGALALSNMALDIARAIRARGGAQCSYADGCRKEGGCERTDRMCARGGVQ